MSKHPLAGRSQPASTSLSSDRRRRAIQPRRLIWPEMSSLRLSAAEASKRLQCVGGSDANIILSGEADRVLRLWREKRGEIAAEDLSAVLPVMLGSWTESFNRQWYERQSDLKVTMVGTSVRCRDRIWRRCTLDGFVEAKDAVFEAKHVGAFFRPEEVLARYMPQLQHNMAVKGCELSLLSVIYGNHKWEVYEIAADWLYQDNLLVAEQVFWDCVKSGEPPLAVPPPPPPRVHATRELCFDGNNLWSASAADWLETREAARRHSHAGASIKDLMDPDVARAYGHGIEAKRSKSGAVTIRETGAMSGQIYVAIAAVIAELAKKGVPKRRRNETDGYAFRGIDDVYNALSRALAKHRLCILPQIIERTVTERRGANGDLLSHVIVKTSFTFIAVEDGSSHTVEFYGEALDCGDKATAKAMSAAYKYACFQTFCIPTEGDNDADAKTHRGGVAGEVVAVPDQGWAQWSTDIQQLVDGCESVMAIEHIQDTYSRELHGLARAEPKLYAKLGRVVRAKRAALTPKRRAA